MSRSLSRAFGVCLIAVAAALPAAPAAGQEYEGAPVFEEISIVDSPTAGILPHGSYLFHGSVGPRNSLLFGIKIGFHERLMIGASFGLQEFIGRGDVEINEKPGFEMRLRLLEERTYRPAFAIGIDTQGEDAYIEEAERYERKSKGFYGVLSKNYNLIRDFSLHGGINYSLENEDEEGVNLFGGFSFGLFPGLSLLLDYSASLDDDDSDVPTHRTRGKGYLDAGVRFDYMDRLRLKVLFKDLLGNYIPENGVARSIEIFYVNYF